MDPSDITLHSVAKNFEYEKNARNIDSISDVQTLRNIAKSMHKLYLNQQEVISKL